MLRLARRLADDGRAVILITHKLRDVSATADRVTVMRAGRTVIDGAPARDLGAAELARAMVGGETAIVRRSAGVALAEVRLELQRLSTAAGEHDVPLRDVGLTLRAGEVLGIAGLGGNGQSELLEAVVGLRPPTAGEIILNGVAAPPLPAGRREAGLRFVPADRFRLGLFGRLTLAQNLALPALSGRHPERRFWVTRRWMRRRAKDAIAEYEVAGAGPDVAARLLSGGNAQKLVLAREFAGQPQLVLAHSPCRGLDMRAAADVQRRLLAAREAGAAVLLVSDDLEEVLALSDRVGVLNRGRLVALLDAPADRQAIGQAMVGHA